MEEDVGDDDLFSTMGCRHQKSGSAYGGDGDATYAPMKKLFVG